MSVIELLRAEVWILVHLLLVRRNAIMLQRDANVDILAGNVDLVGWLG